MRTLSKLIIFFTLLFSQLSFADVFIPYIEPLMPNINLKSVKQELNWNLLYLPYLSDQNDRIYNLIINLAEKKKNSLFKKSYLRYKKLYPSSVKRIENIRLLELFINKNVTDLEYFKLKKEYLLPYLSEQSLFQAMIKNSKNSVKLKKLIFNQHQNLTDNQKRILYQVRLSELINQRKYDELLNTGLATSLARSDIYFDYALYLNLKLRKKRTGLWLKKFKLNKLSSNSLFNMAVYFIRVNDRKKSLAYFNKFISSSKNHSRLTEVKLYKALLSKGSSQISQLNQIKALGRGYSYAADLYLSSLMNRDLPKPVEKPSSYLKKIRWANRLSLYSRQSDPSSLFRYAKMLPMDKMAHEERRYFSNLTSKNIGTHFALLLVKENFSQIYEDWEQLNSFLKLNTQEKLMLSLAAYKSNHLLDLKSELDKKAASWLSEGIDVALNHKQGSRKQKHFEFFTALKNFNNEELTNLSKLMVKLNELNTQVKKLMYKDFIALALKKNKLIDSSIFESTLSKLSELGGNKKLIAQSFYSLIQSENTGPSKMVWACENLLRINPNHLDRDGINLKEIIAKSQLLNLSNRKRLMTQVK